LFILLLLLPIIPFLPSKATSHSFYDNYETETTTGRINVYYQSGAAFQYIQEALSLTNSSLRIIVGTRFYYNTSAASKLQIKFIDNTTGISVTSQNLSIAATGGVKTQYTYYSLSGAYLISRGSHFIRLVGLNRTPTAVHYTDENQFSYYSNQTTGMGNWALHSKQFLIQFIEEDVINLTKNEIKSGRIDYPTNNDAIDAYFLYLPASPVKIILNISTLNKNLNLELYNYTNNGDMALVNSPIKTSGTSKIKILTYVPSSPKYYVLLVKPANYSTDISDYTIRWINSSNVIDVSPPVVNFNNSTMTLGISGVSARMDGFIYNGTFYKPESANFSIYRELGNLNIRNGSLFDNDGNGEWTNPSINLPGLKAGAYYVRATFKDNKGKALGISPKSTRFFVLGNLTVSPATNVTYIGGMTQKINIFGITVNNASSLDVFTYTIFDNNLRANTSISGKLVYNGTAWNAFNIDVSTLLEGVYFILGYFEDFSAKRYGIGNPAEIIYANYTTGTYLGLYSFTDDADGADPAGWNTYEPTGATVGVNSSYQSHLKVVKLAIQNSGIGPVLSQTYSPKVTGTAEWWGTIDSVGTPLGGPSSNDPFFVLLFNTVWDWSRTAATLGFDPGTGKFRYLDSSGWHEIMDFSYKAWYHFRVEWNSTANEKRGGFSLWINGTQYANNVRYYGNSNGTGIQMTYFFIYSPSTSVGAYVDAVDYSWAPGYYLNRNMAQLGGGIQGIVVKYAFLVDHIINVTQVFINYTNAMAQSIKVGALAKASFQGHGIGTQIKINQAIVTFKIYSSAKIYAGISGNLNWASYSWNTTANIANLAENNYYAQVTFSNNSQYYSASGARNSSLFRVDHILDITYISQYYIDSTSQIVCIEVRANTSYQGAGVGVPIANNPNARILCTIVNNTNKKLTQVNGYAQWVGSSSSWKVNISTSSLPEKVFYVMVNFSVISNVYNASLTRNSTTFLINHILTLYVPRPQFNPDTVTLDIVGIIATDSYSGYHHINSTTVKSTYFEIFNYNSKISIGIRGHLIYNQTFDDWRNTTIDLSIYSEGLYFIYVNISSIDVPEGATSNSTPFEIVHKIIISGISLKYTAGFVQTLNITVLHVVSTYKYHSNITYANYRFYFQSNHTAVLNPNLFGNLTWTGSYWRALANISKLPANVYYVMVNFADSTAANSKGSADTTNFTLIHSLSVSKPQLTYINNMNQILNISCRVNSSYYYQRYFNSSSFGSGTYRIYLNNGTATSITGNLQWNGTYWVIKNADISLLHVGSYRIKCLFSSYYATAESSLSNSFTVSHAIEITKPTVIFNNNSKQLTILHAKARSSFFSNGYLTNLTATTSYFEIFTISNRSTGIRGQLSWNGTEWQIRNFAVSLTAGRYYVKLYFNDSQTSLTTSSSAIFATTSPVGKIDWVVMAIILLIAIAVVVILFWTFFSETPERRSEAPKKEI